MNLLNITIAKKYLHLFIFQVKLIEIPNQNSNLRLELVGNKDDMPENLNNDLYNKVEMKSENPLNIIDFYNTVGFSYN